MSRTRVYQPIPPQEMAPARTVNAPGRGEFFLRDTGGHGPVVLLLHGWMVSADLNWHAAYEPLARAGYRVLAIDHRGHGRGLRALSPFRLTDCADDAAAVLAALGIERAIAVGYSMGGAIAQLLAARHPERIAGLVLSATCQHFQDPETVKTWRWMWVIGLMLRIAPRRFWEAGFKRNGISLDERSAWWLSEMMRHSGRDIAEAGRELGRFDSRPWLRRVQVPAAVVLTTRDNAVSPAKQRELAAVARASVYEVAIDHLDVAGRPDEYNPALLAALASVTAAASVPAS